MRKNSGVVDRNYPLLMDLLSWPLQRVSEDAIEKIDCTLGAVNVE